MTKPPENLVAQPCHAMAVLGSAHPRSHWWGALRPYFWPLLQYFRDRKSSRMDHFPWQSQGVLRLRFSEKAICHSITTYHPYSEAIEIFPSPWYCPLPDHGVVLDHWIYSFWGLLFGALQIRLIRGKGSPLFQSSDSHVAMAVFFGLKHLIARRQTSNGG